MQRGYFSGAAVAGLVDGRMLDWGRLLKEEDQRKLDMKLLVAEALCHRDRDRIACKLWVEIGAAFECPPRAIHLKLDVIALKEISPPNEV